MEARNKATIFITDSSISDLTPEELIQKLKSANQTFSYDWRDFKTIQPNINKALELTPIIKQLSLNFSLEAQQELGELCYKLGTFYVHAKKNPTLAFEFLHDALKRLKEHDWIYNHMARSFQQKITLEQSDAFTKRKNAQLAIEYCTPLINSHKDTKDPEKISLLAFAYSTLARVQCDVHQFKEATENNQRALDLYKTIPSFTDPYIQTKIHRATILINYIQSLKIAAGEIEKQVHDIFKEVEESWAQTQTSHNSYLLVFYCYYGDFLTTSKQFDLAYLKYKKAYEIIYEVNGKDSTQTKVLYQKMIQAQDNASFKQLNSSVTLNSTSSPVVKEKEVAPTVPPNKPEFF